MTVHVHVYTVVGLKEYDFENLTELDARVKALADAQKDSSDFHKSDCRFIALAFTQDDQKRSEKNDE